MKKLLLVVGVIVLVSGCQLIEDNAGTIENVVEKAEDLAPLADPLTSGGASPIAHIIGYGVVAFLGINRQVLAWKQKRAIQEIHAHEDSKDAVDQVATESLKKVIAKAVGKV